MFILQGIITCYSTLHGTYREVIMFILQGIYIQKDDTLTLSKINCLLVDKSGTEERMGKAAPARKKSSKKDQVKESAFEIDAKAPVVVFDETKFGIRRRDPSASITKKTPPNTGTSPLPLPPYDEQDDADE